MEHNEIIRTEFSKQAPSFGKKGLTLSSQEYLDWSVSILPLQSHFHVLDVAAGTGHLSRAIAPRVRQVTALDITNQMLEQAKKSAEEAGIHNIIFEQNDAAALPYPDNSFEMVVSRLAIHHFQTPQLQLKEMFRVAKPAHTVAIIDLLSPSDQRLIETYNRLERLRDPSHTLALTRHQLTTAMQTAGLRLKEFAQRDVNVDFENWADMTATPEQKKQTIRQALQAEISTGPPTGMRPYLQDNRLKFLQTWCTIVGTKPS